MKKISDKAILVGFEDFELPEGVEVIGCNATSTEHLDKYREMGIKVVDLKGETEFLNSITSTVEHTIGLMLALARNYKRGLHGPYKERDEYRGHTLAGKTLGIIGRGRIGRQVEKISKALGMKVWALDGNSSRGKYLRWLEKILSMSDFVSLHIPLRGNEGFFTKDMFKQMRPSSYFINTSRGGIVESGALQWALENMQIAGAAVDFIDDLNLLEYEKEHDNLILTNHLGGNTYEDREKTEQFIINKVIKCLNLK